MQEKLAILQLLKHREPTLLIVRQTISGFGDGVALVALTLLVLVSTHPGVTKLAWFAAARVVPFVAFVLFGRVIVDRISRRLLLLISDSMRTLNRGARGLHRTCILQYWELLVFGVLSGTFDAVFTPAIMAITPEIVPADPLPAMSSLRPLSNNVIGNMIGPAIGVDCDVHRQRRCTRVDEANTSAGSDGGRFDDRRRPRRPSLRS
jgi:MFS family permease